MMAMSSGMRYFSLDELCKSSTAVRLGIDNTPDAEAERNLRELVAQVLDPLRSSWGKPIVVNSGYRCEGLNKAVGGAAGSQHRKGLAADIEAVTRKREDNRRLFQLARDLGLPYDQLIAEYGFDWVHISWAEHPRREVLEAVRLSNGKTSYIRL